MDLDSNDAVTSTLLQTESSEYEILSTFTTGENGTSETTLNNTYGIKTGNDNQTTLYDIQGGFNATIDNSFDNTPTVEILDDGEVITTTALVNDLGYLDSFQLENGTWQVGYARGLDNGKPLKRIYGVVGSNNVTVDRIGTEGADESIMVSDGVRSYFNVSNDGLIWWDEFGNRSWILIGDFGSGIFGSYVAPFDIAVAYLEGFWSSYGLVIEDSDDIWEVFIIWDNETYFDISLTSLIYPVQIIFPSQSSSLTIYYGSLVVTAFHTVSNLYFVLIYGDIKIEWYDISIVIVWHFIEITIFFLDSSIHWVIVFWWEWWFIKVQFWYDFSTIWIFTDYAMWIEYRWTTFNWIYIYYVPIINLPNALIVQVTEEVLDEESGVFTITFAVRDMWGALVDPDQIVLSWDDEDFSGDVEQNGTGAYSVELNAIFIEDADDPIDLEIRVRKMGYADGLLNVGIGVNADEQSIPEATDFGDMMSIIITIVSAFLGTLFGVAVVIKKTR